MKRLSSLSGFLPLAALVLTACSTSPISRIDSDRSNYESWPLEVREAVLNGEARKGMSTEQVHMALGKPTQVMSRGGAAGADEVWIYRQVTNVGTGLLNNTGVSIGGGVSGVNVGTGLGRGRGVRRTPEEFQVVFERGVVVKSDGQR